ncbi:hypothetical protein [Bacteroides sp.]|uniref:hypothetical protein n=1 Tax=Bacteroides sp. TaxID=29523 RepID=UPI003A8F2555
MNYRTSTDSFRLLNIKQHLEYRTIKSFFQCKLNSVVGADKTSIKINGKAIVCGYYRPPLPLISLWTRAVEKKLSTSIFFQGLCQSMLVSDWLAAYFSMDVGSYQICLYRLLRELDYLREPDTSYS